MGINVESNSVSSQRREGQVVDDSLSEVDPLSEWHLPSEAYNSLSRLGNPRRGLVRDVLTQRVASPPSEDVVSSRAQRALSH